MPTSSACGCAKTNHRSLRRRAGAPSEGDPHLLRSTRTLRRGEELAENIAAPPKKNYPRAQPRCDTHHRRPPLAFIARPPVGRRHLAAPPSREALASRSAATRPCVFARADRFKAYNLSDKPRLACHLGRRTVLRRRLKKDGGREGTMSASDDPEEDRSKRSASSAQQGLHCAAPSGAISTTPTPNRRTLLAVYGPHPRQAAAIWRRQGHGQ